MTMLMHDILAKAGAKKRRKVVGRGESSGHGKTSGKGNKGSKARAGGLPRQGYEGGQVPLWRRMPKFGFSNFPFQTDIEVVNLDRLEARFATGEVVNKDTLQRKRLISGNALVIKVLGDGTLTKALTVEVDEASESARKKIEGAGGKLTVSPAAEARRKARLEAEAAAVVKAKAEAEARAKAAEEKAKKAAEKKAEKPAKGEKEGKEGKPEKGEKAPKGEKPAKSEKPKKEKPADKPAESQ